MIKTLKAQPDSNSNVGTFDLAKTRAQQFSVILGALDSQIAAANFSSRVATLANNYRSIDGDIAGLHDIELFDLAAGASTDKCQFDDIQPQVSTEK